MPLTKQYLTYTAECQYGVVTGRKGGACLFPGAKKGRVLAVSPALEDVKLWDLRTSAVVSELKGSGEEVCVVHVGRGATGERVIATGLEDGSVKLWDVEKETTIITFSGHRSAVSCLRFNFTHTQLVSGSKDTHVIVWDTVAEAGLVRFKGHKGPITDCQWLSDRNVLITSSKDGLVKLWDLDTQHCFQTIVSHHKEVWSLELVGGPSLGEGVVSLPRLVTASGDNRVRLFQLSVDNPGGDDAGSLDQMPVVATEMGSITMGNLEHLSLVRRDPSGRYLACLCQSHGVELYRVQNEDELQHTLKRRRKRAAKKSADGEEEAMKVNLSLTDELKLVCTIKGNGKHRWVDLIPSSSGKEELLVLLTLQNNMLELHSVSGVLSRQLYSVVTPGHRADVRTLCLSLDNSCILSGSAREVKIWRRSSQHCVTTMASRYALCSTFIPGNRFVLIGTKSGHLQLFDVSSGSLLEEVAAHQGAVWGLSLTPDKMGIISGSADKSVRFWEFELISPENGADEGKKLTLCPTRTLKLSEDVLSVCPSPAGHLLAVALLDSTIKVFFTDTLKFFLSLYGHKLPVLSMNISSDGALLVSSSADKNLRIWGLDFGDCHKSIFAHEDSITSVLFLPDTHLLFSASKDSTIKCWDADNFQHVQTLKGHHSEVWCLAVSDDGDTLVSGSHDLSIRVWQRTREPLVLSEQKEMEREAFMDQLSGADSSITPVIPGEVSGEASLPSSTSKDRLSVVDRLLEALSVFREDADLLAEHRELCTAAGKELAAPKRHPILVAMGDIQGDRYVMNVLKGIKSSELEECLLVMPFDQVTQFLKVSQCWLEHGYEVELVCRCVFFLLRVHQPQLVSSPHLLHSLSSLALHTHTQVTRIKDLYGFNLAGLQYLRREVEGRGTRLFQDAPSMITRKRKRKYKS